MGETPITLTVHGVTLAGVVVILGVMLKQHKIWIRLKDRVNDMWSDYCEAHGIKYKPIENGKSGD